jgi:hypothetical protein
MAHVGTVGSLVPSISKAATVSQTDEWRSDRRTRLYHSCIDILAQEINDLTGRDIYFRFGDHKYRRSRVFLDFLCMPTVADWSRRTYPAPLGAGGVGSIPANSDAQKVPSFSRWRFEMKLSPFAWTGTRYQTQQCVQPHSARVAGVQRIGNCHSCR